MLIIHILGSIKVLKEMMKYGPLESLYVDGHLNNNLLAIFLGPWVFAADAYYPPYETAKNLMQKALDLKLIPKDYRDESISIRQLDIIEYLTGRGIYIDFWSDRSYYRAKSPFDILQSVLEASSRTQTVYPESIRFIDKLKLLFNAPKPDHYDQDDDKLITCMSGKTALWGIALAFDSPKLAAMLIGDKSTLGHDYGSEAYSITQININHDVKNVNRVVSAIVTGARQILAWFADRPHLFDNETEILNIFRRDRCTNLWGQYHCLLELFGNNALSNSLKSNVAKFVIQNFKIDYNVGMTGYLPILQYLARSSSYPMILDVILEADPKCPINNYTNVGLLHALGAALRSQSSLGLSFVLKFPRVCFRRLKSNNPLGVIVHDAKCPAKLRLLVRAGLVYERVLPQNRPARFANLAALNVRNYDLMETGLADQDGEPNVENIRDRLWYKRAHLAYIFRKIGIRLERTNRVTREDWAKRTYSARIAFVHQKPLSLRTLARNAVRLIISYKINDKQAVSYGEDDMNYLRSVLSPLLPLQLINLTLYCPDIDPEKFHNFARQQGWT